MTLTDIFKLVAGIALFLYGMSAMGEGLNRVAGNRLESILWKLSSNPLKGVLLGTGVTAVIQSSSATSCMVVGFVNSKMMRLTQAIAIIMGANIGTTATGWILCLSTLEGQGKGWIELLSTTFISSLIAVIGILLRMLSKVDFRKRIGDIMLGFAVLMFGMQMMSGSVSGLKDSAIFSDMMTAFSNPLLGIFAGIVITSVLQSASASIGIVQALSLTGVIPYSTAIPVVMGMCIGASVPVLLSAIGATTNGKRASVVYLFFNTIGTIIISAIFYSADAILGFSFMEPELSSQTVVSPVGIAVINTLFNAITTVLLFPFIKQFEKLISFLIREKKAERPTEFDRLDERFLAHPSLAVEQSRSVMCSMAQKSQENLSLAIGLLSEFTNSGYTEVANREELVDKYEDHLGSYLVKITGMELDKKQSREVSKFLHTIGDFERIADHAVNISDVAKEINEKKLVFSFEAMHELDILAKAVTEIVSLSVKAFELDDDSLAYRVEPLEEMIDLLCDELKLRHINRIQKGNCTLNQGFVFSDLLTNYERIADHCSNVAVALIELDLDTFDTHAYLNELKEHRDGSFAEYFEEYKLKYSV